MTNRMGLLSSSVDSVETTGGLDELDKALGLATSNQPEDKNKKVSLLSLYPLSFSLFK